MLLFLLYASIRSQYPYVGSRLQIDCCQDSADDESSLGNDIADQQDNDLPSQDLIREGYEFEDLPQ